MKQEESMESRIKQAMRPRVQHFRDQADSLTFEKVRRLLEKDMALDTYALDSHKKFVKQLLEKFLSGEEEEEDELKAEDDELKAEDDESKAEDDKSKAKDDESKAEDDKSKGLEQIKSEEESVKEAKVEDSPVMGLLSETQGDAKGKIPTEDMIKEAIWNKATYFRSNSEELTLAGVRRLLEEDLELQKFSLDSFKKLISKQLDEVLNSENNKDADSSPSHGENENIQPKVKPKKKPAVTEKVKKSEGTKKRKKPAQETEKPRKKKHPKELSDEKNNVEDQSSDESSGGNSVKKEVVAPVYGKKVELLKSIIKACGMAVAPTVYKKAKQAPEDKREAVLVKELQEILSKEGLSTNPSEKEIKEVKRRKERAKELEGIDTSNIVQGSRRRSTTFFPPPKPIEPVESDSDDDSEDGLDNQEEDDHASQSGEDDQDEDVNATQSGEEVHAETFDSD